MTFARELQQLRSWSFCVWVCTMVLMTLSWVVPKTANAQNLPLATEPMTVADGTTTTLDDVSGPNGLVITFWSNRCLWVERYTSRVKALADAYAEQGVRFVVVNSNDASVFAEEGMEQSAKVANELSPFITYLMDSSGALAQALNAGRTPHTFVFNAGNELVYQGAFDDSPGDPDNVTQPYVTRAVEGLVNGTPIAVAETKAFGCTLRLPRGN